jgi:hypothetical protein
MGRSPLESAQWPIGGPPSGPAPRHAVRRRKEAIRSVRGPLASPESSAPGHHLETRSRDSRPSAITSAPEGPLSAANSGPVPIVVGVTGHADLRPEDAEPLAVSVRGVLDALRARYPHSSLLVLSPLAEGADRLVARIALDLGLRVIVPMPLELQDYRTDFADAASLAEFQAILARAERSFVVPYGEAEPRTRPQCYARVGAYVSRHSHVLLALWNGHTPNKIGGTAEIVHYRLKGTAPEFGDTVRLFNTIETGVVYHIVTPRRSDPSTDGPPFRLRVLKPDRHGDAATADPMLDPVCRSTDAFNAIGGQRDAGVVARRTKGAGYLLPQYGPHALPAGLQTIRAFYACADEAAIRFQQRTLWTLRGLFCLAFGIVVAFEIFAHGEELAPSFSEPAKLLLYLVLLGCGFALYKWAAAREIDKKYLDYRALAEGLRVDFYWRVAQVRSSAADHCMRYRLEEMEWIRMALRSCELLASAVFSPDTAESSVAALRAVVEDWAQGQYHYFGRTQRRLHAVLKKLERRTDWLLVVSVLAGVAVFVSTFRLLPWISTMREQHPVTHTLAVALIGLSTAAAALIHGYAEQRALSVQVKRYERMHALFGTALRVLEAPMKAGDWDTARSVLGELGREALEENADWVMLHRDRPIELPA